MEGRPLEDDALVERARAGDKHAYEQLVRRHQDIAFRTAYLVCGRTGDAEDAAQDAFIKAYRALGRFRAGGSFKSWLLAIVANEARNRLRSARRRGGLALRHAEARPSGDAAPSPEEAVVDLAEREELMAALAALSHGDRLALVYRYFFDMGETEMAEALGCARGTVKSRLSRARKRIRAALEESREGADK